ncbi:MAG: rhodanese-like domain-containing protein [Flavobacteriales bacterium]|nr:rhodanese-like domain-containing protein [Flavobacteriales bacterium]NQX98860.1 rhodanese-like domain-containing protein [Flavobacteriales bacterium]
MKRQFIILLFLTLGFSAFAQEYESFEELKNDIISKTIPLISVENLKKVEKTKSKLLIIDAREESEYNVSHIKGAEYVGYDNFKIKNLKGVDRETTIVVYCSVGYRSEKIGEKLKKVGFTKVMNLQGGIFDWVNKGYSVYDNEGNKTKKIHAYSKSWSKWLTKGEKVYE